MKHLELEERIKIGEYVKEGKSLRCIARILGRNHSTIKRELDRNTSVKGEYIPHQAHSKATARIHSSQGTLKILENPDLMEFILDKLQRLKWSPGLIAWALKTQYNEALGTVSHETIYQFIYPCKPEYTRYFLTKRKKRKARASRNSHSRILFRTSIHERPDFINDRRSVGHWESDTMEFSNKKAYLSVQVERSTGFVSIRKVSSKSASHTLFALQQTKKDFPVFSVTFDNGTEGAWHYKLNVSTYFCDPYASWQKGLVEYSNRIIRQFFPRHINPQCISHSDVAQVQFFINSRPRPSLNFRSSLQAFSSSLSF